jgi:hypothetical protein
LGSIKAALFQNQVTEVFLQIQEVENSPDVEKDCHETEERSHCHKLAGKNVFTGANH